jgi:peptidyl-prolyl cis-trans isomerase C
MSRFPADKRNQMETEEGRKQLLDQVISWELLYANAVDSGFEEKEEYKIQLEEAKKAILTQIAIQEIISGITVDDKELLGYYEENKEYFKEEEKVTARHILVDSEDKAYEVLKAIEGGLSFEEAAQTYSSCPSKAQGGNLGEFGRGMMVPEFELAAFSLKVGTISHPVQTQFGYHIIEVQSREDAHVKPLEEVRAMILNHMLQEKQNFYYSKALEDLKAKYKIEIK